MEVNRIEFVRNDKGRLEARIELPSRINLYVNFKGKGSVRAFVVVEGISEPVLVGTSDYGPSVAMDINLISGTTVLLKTQSEVAEAVYIS